MGKYRERDDSLRRIKRDTAVICVVAILGALVVDRGRPGLAYGVLAGAGMMAIGYAAVRSMVDASIWRAAPPAGEDSAPPPNARRAITRATVRFVSRYALVAAVAVVALGPLRADPIGLFVGVTVPVVAIAIEAVRLVRQPQKRSW